MEASRSIPSVAKDRSVMGSDCSGSGWARALGVGRSSVFSNGRGVERSLSDCDCRAFRGRPWV